jgi:hypothetical protein
MDQHLIIAPHPDDEIIGCFNLLLHAKYKKVAVYYPFCIGDEPGIERAAKRFSFSVIRTLETFQELIEQDRNQTHLYAPDVYFETHPEHRKWGFWAEQQYRRRLVSTLTFYSTIMRAPYIFEVSVPRLKKDALDKCYPEKQSLWDSDHRYFLFEGMCQWKNPNYEGES